MRTKGLLNVNERKEDQKHMATKALLSYAGVPERVDHYHCASAYSDTGRKRRGTGGPNCVFAHSSFSGRRRKLPKHGGFGIF